MDEEEKIELYLKGYKEGHKEAWNDIESLVSKYDGWDLRSRVESKIGTLYQEVDSKRTELEQNPEILIPDEEEKPDEPATSDREISWNKGDAYLFIEKKPQSSLEELSDVMKKGASALIIVRQSPDKIIEKYDLPENRSRFVWLTSSEGGSELDVDITARSPSDLSGLSNEIGNYMKNNQKGVIFLSGLPLMTNYNEQNKVLKFLNFSRDKVTENDGCLVTSISGDALEEKFLEKIKGEFDRTLK